MPLIRIEFEKTGRLKYISHLDLIRTIQRAVRRAGIPVEYSTGFNPHSRISFGPALAVGISSGSEYMDMELKEAVAEEGIVEGLNDSLPQGIRITRAVYIPDRAPSLTAVINAARYIIRADYRPRGGEWESRIRDFFHSQEVLLEKTDKRGRKRMVNVMPMILEVIRVEAKDGKLAMDVMLETGSNRNLRPADLLEAIGQETGLEFEAVGVHRERLLVKRDGGYYSPMETDGFIGKRL